MLAVSDGLKNQVIRSAWFRALSKYERPHLGKAVWQLANTLVPFIALWILMVWMVQRAVPYWYLLPPLIVTAGLMVRIYIFFHDCTHSSFFVSRTANKIVGAFCGILTFTPFDMWRTSHTKHHVTAEDLDHRGTGDIWTLTVEEYLAAPRWKQILYRLFRNPCFLFGVAAPFLFLIVQRFTDRKATRESRNSVTVTNVAIVAILIAAHFTIGLRTYLLIQIPAICVASTMGVWLFYVQHQYEEVYWARHDAWDPIRAALHGSSYYKLPKVLQWFSGNIGLHHIHHLRPRIPNYNLQRCYDEVAELRAVEPLTLRKSFKSLFLALWHEREQKMVGFRALKAYKRQVVS
jgi:omega-6 fatty acid desaturase (delta-12 desaturase)